MRAVIPSGVELDPSLFATLAEAIDPGRRLVAAIERIVPLSGRRVAEVDTGIGQLPLILARRTGRVYGIESDPALLEVAHRRAAAAHQPNIRIVEGTPESVPLRSGVVDVVLSTSLVPDDTSLPAMAEAFRILRPGGRLIAIGHYGRDDLAALLEPEVVAHTVAATQRRTGWWFRHGFRVKVVHTRMDFGDPASAQELLPRLYGDRGRAFLMGSHPAILELKLGLYHLTRPGA